MGHTVYCPTCEKVVELRRKNFDHRYHEILCFSVMLTLGLGFLIYIALKYSKKPNTCPNCESVFELNKVPSKGLNIAQSIGSKNKFMFP